MTAAELELARELARHPGWRFVPGVRRIWTGEPRPGFGVYRVQDGDDLENPKPNWIPDLSDPATQGCLIAMLCDRLGALHRRGAEWSVSGRLRSDVHINMPACGSLGEALARAWLAVQR